MANKTVIIAAAFFGIAGTTSPLTAQSSAGPCPGMYPAPRVGEYAELRFRSSEQGTMPVRFAVVGEEDVFGRPHYWIEIVSVPPAVQDTVVVQMLVPHYPFEQNSLRGYIVRMPGQPAIRFPEEMLPELAGSTAGPGWKEQCQSAEDLGNERVTVPAGNFIARHYRAPDGGEEVWIADVPFGMVKMVTADGALELLRHGTDARSLITEEPVEYQPQPPGR
ncbi:MAG: hypothetical protein GWN99_02955 [Gemmatimonadetes bacterium]|uniref:Uncharacterized protein n=1 Tax=Candidatus Kutchimonas denitrificans TaxID=3056748 RepID=A0AAE4Z6Z6_9BACT|nr:hypothetical protein [Gemmatimonadota bacterium]NIR74915.1 hypothetical protein [Candidatus Kutchimonas denitrificans]NIS00027.1 hypothetical protein [Gemmatimonadota bacterium]NIT65610.1 hypothetical protein [Gemmatimonadota bacterium]NIU52580.1 hypothetical protein [Gemmatimonadota bacterium]